MSKSHILKKGGSFDHLKRCLGIIGMVFAVKIELSIESFLHFLGWNIYFAVHRRKKTDSILPFLLL